MNEINQENGAKKQCFKFNIPFAGELNTKIIYPREFVKSSEKVCTTRFRAPLIGEHNEEIYSEIGLSQRDLVTLKQARII